LQQLRANLAELKQKELTMAQDLGDRHPELIKLRSEIELADKRLANELGKVIESVKSDFTAAKALEDNLVAALEAQKREVLDLNRKSLEFSALQRQATSDRQIYEKLLGETQARGITGKTPEWRIRVVESAELPRYPVSPQRTQQYLLALCGGLCLAIAAPFLREGLDYRVKTPADIQKRLGLRCVALVPTVKVDAGANGPLFTNEPTAFNEAFRRIRADVFLGPKAAGAVRILVTSAVPREGKSVVAVNLAMAFAQMTQRVLLIDGDLRRPKVHKLLGIQPHPGFADALSGQMPVGDAIRPTQVPNLFVLTCGLKRRSTAELLSGPQFEQILDELGESFDWIVFDSPPTAPVADPCVIGRLVEHVFLVIGAESTPMAVVRNSIEQLETAGLKIDGAILNRVDLEHSGYYYAPYYSGGYSDYLPKPAVTSQRPTRTMPSASVSG
jgi:capsular exopolysaccharide synthesis family protein